MPDIILRAIMPAKKKRKRRSDYMPSSPSKQNFIYSSRFWKELPLTTQADFNALCLKMQQGGLLSPGPHQSGYTLYQQMSRAVASVYRWRTWADGDVPRVASLPPSLPEFGLAATNTDGRTVVRLTAPAYSCGCQVWMSDRFVPGCCDPFKKRTKIVGALPDGWPDGGVDINTLLDKPNREYWFRAQKGAAFVVKIVPVTPDGFVGPSLSEWCVVE